MAFCSFCPNDHTASFSGLMIGLTDGRYVCTRCLPRLSVGPGFTRQQLDDLVKLCHPDRHRGPMEKLATKTTQWLLDLRKKVKA